MNLWIIPATALGRAIFGWAENSLKDGKVDLPELKKLGETIIRMGVPMLALVFGLNFPVEISAGIVVLLDIIITKIYSALKKK